MLRGINILNKYLSKPLEFYQGTLVIEHGFEIEKLQEMAKYGFKRARLGVNLLGIKKEEAKQMADLYSKMSVESKEFGMWAKDRNFDTYTSILSSKENRKKYNFHCMGLSSLAGKSITYNIDTEMVNHLCSFSTDTQVGLDKIDNDIYHPLIFEKGLNFLRRRFEVFKEMCQDCEIAGICRGGCFLTGLDAYNRKNEAACVFQKETWKHFLRYMYKTKNAGFLRETKLK